MYKKGRVNSNSRIISTDEDPSLRIESSAIINLRGVSTKLNKYISGSNVSVCRSIIRDKLKKNLLFQVKYRISYSRKRICQNRLPKCE